MRRSAAPSFRAAKRGRFIPPILGSKQQENNRNRNNISAEELEVCVYKLSNDFPEFLSSMIFLNCFSVG